MSTGESRSTAATLFKFLLVGIAVVILFKVGILLLGLALGGAIAILGLGIALVVGVGMLVVFLSVAALPFILLGWMVSVAWRALFGTPTHA